MLSAKSDCRIFKPTISQEQIDETASFLACWYNLQKLKVDWNFIVYIGVPTPSFKNTTPIFLAKPPLNVQTLQAPPPLPFFF